MRRKIAQTKPLTSQYKMEIHHIPGKKNLVPDALSKLPAEGNEEIPNAIDPEANDNELNDIWSSEVYYTTTKLHMDQALKEKFIRGITRTSTSIK